MENMDFPAAVKEIIEIQKKCEKLRLEAAEIAQRTDRVSSFLCALIGLAPGNKPFHCQNIVVKETTGHNGTWKDIIINDLKANGKSYTEDILDRYVRNNNVTGKEEKRKIVNTIRTSLARFKNEGLVKKSDGEKHRIIWEAI